MQLFTELCRASLSPNEALQSLTTAMTHFHILQRSHAAHRLLECDWLCFYMLTLFIKVVVKKQTFLQLVFHDPDPHSSFNVTVMVYGVRATDTSWEMPLLPDITLTLSKVATLT